MTNNVPAQPVVDKTIWFEIVGDQRKISNMNEAIDAAVSNSVIRLHGLGAIEVKPIVLIAKRSADRVDASRLRLHAPRLGQLFERREARLVADHILAVPHRRDADSRPICRDSRAGDQRNALVLQYLACAARRPCLRILAAIFCRKLRLRRVEGNQLRPRRSSRSVMP